MKTEFKMIHCYFPVMLGYPEVDDSWGEWVI